jgi:hypothetical protein
MPLFEIIKSALKNPIVDGLFKINKLHIAQLPNFIKNPLKSKPQWVNFLFYISSEILDFFPLPICFHAKTTANVTTVPTTASGIPLVRATVQATSAPM